MRIIACIGIAALGWLAGASGPSSAGAAGAPGLRETPMFQADVAAKKLPPVESRVPSKPLVVAMDGKTVVPGKPGGELRTLIGRARDVRMMVVYGYARLAVYNRDLAIEPDILESIKVDEGRIFTMKLRPGHKWSDGKPFTTADFRYYWEDIANNPELSPNGPPIELLADGEKPKVEIVDPTTVRYSWSKANPFFLPRMAGSAPLFIFRPAHYLKQFHGRYAEPKALAAAVAAANAGAWPALHNRLDNMYEFDNPDLPTLQPWRITNRPPATRFVAERNPYFHRVDPNGVQLPYIDRVILSQADVKLIPAKAGAGEADLQARNLAFDNFTFLKQNEARSGYRTLLWRSAKGSQVALYPNLNVKDPVWRQLVRDVRFRRALSHAIDRGAVNQSIYFGLAIEGNNTVLPESPLFKADYQTRHAKFDLAAANRLLDELGLQRGGDGIRQLPDKRPLEIVIETAGEEPEQVDVLQLVAESWKKAGIRLLVKPSQRDVVRNRVYSGEALMAVWSGLENGVATADHSPAELAPTAQTSLQWPMWGQHHETKGAAGEAPDMPSCQALFKLYQDWIGAAPGAAREAIWREMLEVHADNLFTIGIVGGVQQPVVVNRALRNVPEKGIYNWEPGAYFGIYRPETFWLDR
jgi:peptide/nickel transport system substrate-binding protein